MTSEAYKLSQLFGGIWGGCPDYPLEDWQSEVANNYTRLGYWDYVLNSLEQEKNDE